MSTTNASIVVRLADELDHRPVGTVTLRRDLTFDVIPHIPKEKEPLIATLKEIFSDGVYRLWHVTSSDPEEKNKRVWVKKDIDRDSSFFFPAAIDMLERAGFEVSFDETEERTLLIRQLQKYIRSSSVDLAYKHLIQQRYTRLTAVQLRELVATFEKERSGI